MALECRGVPLELDDSLPERCRILMQVRFPRSKKRRIREKWAFRSKNYKRFEVLALFVKCTEPPTLVMHPRAWEIFGTWMLPTEPTEFEL